MKVQVCLILSMCLVSMILKGEPDIEKVKASVAEPSELELSTRIVDQTYCDDGTLSLTLQFRYRNAGKNKLILPRYAGAARNHRISKSLADALKKKYEDVSSPMMGATGGKPNFGNVPPSEYFVILAPGESYDAENTVKELIFTDGGGHRGKGRLKPGDHFLQVEVYTWPFPSVSKEEIRQRWLTFGDLWTNPLVSAPMAFNVSPPATRSLQNCNSPNL